MLLFCTAGLGLRARPRRCLPLAAIAVALAATLSACGGPDVSTPPASGAATSADPSTSSPSGTGPLGDPGVERIAGLELRVASFAVPEALDAEGGAELAAMLDTLGLQASDVLLEVAIDPEGSLSIGRWQVPGAGADAILAAWEEAVDGWTTTTLAGRDALMGRGVDGGRAWATASDGLFVYIVTDDRDLAEAAAAAD